MYPQLQCESQRAPACFSCSVANIPTPETRALIAEEGGKLAVRAMDELALSPGMRIGEVELSTVYSRPHSVVTDPFLERHVFTAAQQAILNARCMNG